MKVWLPYVVGGSGSDTFTRSFANQLSQVGHTAVAQPFPRWMQFAPDALRLVQPPPGTDLALTNSRSGFAFARTGLPMVTVEHLCVHVPDVASFRSPLQKVFHESLIRPYERRSFSSADLVVAVSRATSQDVALAFPGIHPLVIHNAVDTSFFSPAHSLTRDAKALFRVLFVGNLTARKGADLIPGIANTLGPEFELAYTSGLRGCRRRSIQGAVPLGHLDRSAVRDAYQTADALIMPSRLEGFSTVVLEAMSCGLPVVASDRSSMPEIIEDGKTGLLCPLEPGAFVDAIRRLASDEPLRREFSDAGRRRVVEHFRIEQMVDRYVLAFQRLIG